MTSEWIERRKEYRYAGFLFSPDGRVAREGAVEYREIEFSAGARRRFRLWLAVVIAFTFPGIPLLASTGLGTRLLWIVAPVLVFAWWLHRRIHACPQCGGRSRELTTPHMDAPVLHLCPRCRTFFEHGTIDGGWPGK
jgi:hypothetical protein